MLQTVDDVQLWQRRKISRIMLHAHLIFSGQNSGLMQ